MNTSLPPFRKVTHLPEKSSILECSRSYSTLESQLECGVYSPEFSKFSGKSGSGEHSGKYCSVKLSADTAPNHPIWRVFFGIKWSCNYFKVLLLFQLFGHYLIIHTSAKLFYAISLNHLCCQAIYDMFPSFVSTKLNK